VVARVWAIERDPASWRDAGWCLLHAIVGCVTSTVSFALFASGVFYLIYPFLYWVTPDKVFRQPFGDQWTLHSVGASAVVMPAALVCFLLWYALVIPLARAEVLTTRALLGRPTGR
jgi:Putative sensor